MIQYAYRGLHGCHSVCGLNIIPLADGRTVVICTELTDNPGTSVTNFAEELAAMVCRQFGIPFERLVWIEHYPPRLGFEADWDRVTFTTVRAGADVQFEDPQWRPMQPEDWTALGLVAPDT